MVVQRSRLGVFFWSWKQSSVVLTSWMCCRKMLVLVLYRASFISGPSQLFHAPSYQRREFWGKILFSSCLSISRTCKAWAETSALLQIPCVGTNHCEAVWCSDSPGLCWRALLLWAQPWGAAPAPLSCAMVLRSLLASAAAVPAASSPCRCSALHSPALPWSRGGPVSFISCQIWCEVINAWGLFGGL